MTGWMTKAFAGALAVTLSACGPLVQIGGGGAVPDSLLTLESTAGPPGPLSGPPLLIRLPEVPGKVRTMRIPVTTASNQIQYLADANWIEQPNLLFQQLVADVVTAQLNMPVIEESNPSISPRARLSGRLLEFGLDVTGAPQVEVRYDAVLTASDGSFIGSRSFTAREPVLSQSGPDVADALSTASNRIAVDLAGWLGSSLG